MSAERKTETIPEWKREEVADLVALLEQYDSVGIIDLTGIPSRQLQDMRRDLHGTAEVRVSRNTLVVRALEEVHEGEEGPEALSAYVSGQIGLIGTDENPFGLYRRLEESKTSAPIGVGEVAPDDVVVPEGDTGIDDLQMVGDFNNAGVNARPEDGTITVMEEAVVLKAGEEVGSEVASVLGELGIEPKEVGLDLRAVHSDGVLFEPGDLELDLEAYERDVGAAAARARNLSINAAFPTEGTIPALLSRATGEAKAVGLEARVEDPDVLPDLIGRADAQVRALAARIDDDEALPEDLADVEAPAAGPADEPDDEDEPSDERPDAEADADDEVDDDDDEEGGGDALGEMFG